MKIQRIVSTLSFSVARLMGTPFYTWASILKKPYHILVPAATYAPWITDDTFRDLYRKVRPHSLVNRYQAWELWSLVGRMESIPGDILEVGVWRGSTSILMGKKLQMLQSKKRIWACDTFSGVVKQSRADNFYEGGEHADTSVQFVAGLIQSFSVDRITLLKGIFPEDTGSAIEGEHFSICHIDVDTYQSALDVVNWVWPRLATGGVIVFNDYAFGITRGITKLVNEQALLPGRVMIHNLNGNGILVKVQ
ncbi:TylF/MycF/NovP-related O-methyltransferase [Rurimicrobium arvi]|uniref:Methyltransferase n=1 Tax=Rurimicrobium arvi TaxID=2049916 RepID=A0ABP8MDE0_9BACT